MAEGYSPTDGMKSAARRALAWKKEGKRGGTRIGLTRANQIVGGESLSESTVMRMYSFFSRHEVDKKATGFSSGEEGFPSPGRVAWDLWGGDAGYSWSRQKAASIKNKRMNKMSSVWDGAFLGQLGKEQNSDIDELVLEEEVDAPLDVETTPNVEAPAVEAEPVVETPAPVVETPAPVVETPAPVAETPAPAPVAEAPVEAPAEPVEAPAAPVETPAEAPVAEAPTTEPTA